MTAAQAYRTVDSDQPALLAAVQDALAADRGPAPAVPIGLVGCGWIGGEQLAGYRDAGFDVVALCDRNPGRAEEYRSRYAPTASAYESLDALLAHPGLALVDVATHLDGRPEIIRQCLDAGLHVLSQKPFVEDLAVGEELAALADARGLTLAANQNGRWAPHFGAMLAMVSAGLIGEVISADFSVAWPHDQMTAGMPAFAEMSDLVLFDFGAHWFDIIAVLAPPGALEVRAVSARRPGQETGAPLQASAIVTGANFLATTDFRAGERFAESGQYRVVGTRGVITHTGLSLGGDSVRLDSDGGSATVQIADDWFAHALPGSMGALLRAIDRGQAPPHQARSVLRGLAIAFAALESARRGDVIAVGLARTRAPAEA